MITNDTLLNTHDIIIIIMELSLNIICSIFLYKGIDNYYDNVEKILYCKNKTEYILLCREITKNILMMFPFFISILIPSINF